MRIFLLASTLLLSCKSESSLSFLAIKEAEMYRFEKAITVSEFIDRAEALKCEGYDIVAKSIEDTQINNSDFIIKTVCKFPDQLKFAHTDGIQLPIYAYNGFRKYGINLCEDEKTNFKLLKEFYLNPKRRDDYPSKPENAIVKLIVDESSTLKSITPIIKDLKKLTEELDDSEFDKPYFASKTFHVTSIENWTGIGLPQLETTSYEGAKISGVFQELDFKIVQSIAGAYNQISFNQEFGKSILDKLIQSDSDTKVIDIVKTVRLLTSDYLNNEHLLLIQLEETIKKLKEYESQH